MIIPSVDIQGGQAVQLRQGKERVIDGGDPLERLAEFSPVGEVAVIDLDAALGDGNNEPVIEQMVRRAPCRVGGGIRSYEQALRWLDAGASKIILGTAATPELCARLPKERLIAAVDARKGQIVDRGWTRATGRDVLQAIEDLAPYVGGFLMTQVEFEGEMGGFDSELVMAAQARCGVARLTVAGGITTAKEIAELDGHRIDAQVGMALYSGQLKLADCLAELLRRTDDPNELWPTVVCDEQERALGLVWSNRESLAAALKEKRGVYWSRSRQSLWRKGESSGNDQELKRIELDCDRDALRFVVRQRGAGFCHLERRSCWGEAAGLAALEQTLLERKNDSDPASGTVKLLHDPALLSAKLVEEARELAEACRNKDRAEIIREAADLTYFTQVALCSADAGQAEVVAELALRNARVTRRPMQAKPGAREPK